jgi:solute carrier family 25 (mitochondrial folate transporter), member 32
MLDGLRQILRMEGIRGFFSGLTPSLIGVSHGAVQFMFYEDIKKWRLRQKRATPHPQLVHPREMRAHENNTEWVMASSVSKTLALMVTYPYQVIRSRLQTHDARTTYTSARDAIRKTFSAEGLLGFYKGCPTLLHRYQAHLRLTVSIIRVLPGTIITFLVYENINRAFEHK